MLACCSEKPLEPELRLMSQLHVSSVFCFAVTNCLPLLVKSSVPNQSDPVVIKVSAYAAAAPIESQAAPAASQALQPAAVSVSFVEPASAQASPLQPSQQHGLPQTSDAGPALASIQQAQRVASHQAASTSGGSQRQHELHTCTDAAPEPASLSLLPCSLSMVPGATLLKQGGTASCEAGVSTCTHGH